MEPKKYTKQYSVIFAGEAHRALLCAALPQPYVCVRNRAEFVAATTKRKSVAIAFVDIDLLYQIEGALSNVPIVGIVDDSGPDTLANTVRTLDSFGWMSHLLIASILSTPLAKAHLTMLLERLAFGPEHGMLGAEGVGRVALLAAASRREARFARMLDFFAKQGLTQRSLGTINEIAEELVMNALYDAPVEAGYFEAAVPRTEDVSLPADRACEISYGIERGNVFVRVRDTFGALSRTRLLDVLNRCASRAVALDESRGGAGLGIWRVFSTASTISITVIPGRLTDILVGISVKDGRLSKQLQAVHLFFVPDTNGSLDSLIPQSNVELIDNSVTLVLVA